MSGRFQKIFFPASILFIWLALFSKALLGHSVWINELYIIDTFTEYFHFKEFIRHSYLEGFFPLWTHNNECGFPFAAFPHTGSFYPPGLLFLLMKYGNAINWFSFVHIVFMSFCAYLCASELGYSRLVSWMTTLAFGMTGFPFIVAGAVPTLSNHCWLPAVFLLSLRLTRKASFGNFLGLVFASAFQALACDPEMIIYQTVYLFAFLILARRAPGRKIPILVFALCLSWLMVSIQLVPGADFIFHSYRRVSADMNSSANFDWFIVPAGLLVPFSFKFFGQTVPSPMYSGFLLLPGLFFAWRNRETRRGFYVMSGFAVLVLILVINPHPIKNLGAIGLIAPDARYKLLEPFQFWMLLVVGAGTDQMLRSPLAENRIRLLRRILIAFAMLAALVAAAAYRTETQNPRLPLSLLAPYRAVFAAAALAVILAMYLLRKKEGLLKSFTLPAIAALFIIDIGGVSLALRPDQPPELFSKVLPGREFLARQAPTSRYRFASLYSTWIPMLDLQIIRYQNLYQGPGYIYSFIRPGLYSSTPLLVRSAAGESNLGFLNINAKERELMDQLGVRYIVGDAPAFWGVNPYPVNTDRKGFLQSLNLLRGAEKSAAIQFFPGDELSFQIRAGLNDSKNLPLKIYLRSAGGEEEISPEPKPSFPQTTWQARLQHPFPRTGRNYFQAAG